MPSAGGRSSATTLLLFPSALENFEDLIAEMFMIHLALKSQKYEMSFVIQKDIKYYSQKCMLQFCFHWQKIKRETEN